MNVKVFGEGYSRIFRMNSNSNFPKTSTTSLLILFTNSAIKPRKP